MAQGSHRRRTAYMMTHYSRDARLSRMACLCGMCLPHQNTISKPCNVEWKPAAYNQGMPSDIHQRLDYNAREHQMWDWPGDGLVGILCLDAYTYACMSLTNKKKQEVPRGLPAGSV